MHVLSLVHRRVRRTSQFQADSGSSQATGASLEAAATTSSWSSGQPGLVQDRVVDRLTSSPGLKARGFLPRSRGTPEGSYFAVSTVNAWVSTSTLILGSALRL